MNASCDAGNFDVAIILAFRQDMHISSLRTRKSTMPETADKLESLRQKQEKVQLQEREFKLEYERKMDELQFKKQELDKREVCPCHASKCMALDL